VIDSHRQCWLFVDFVISFPSICYCSKSPNWHNWNKAFYPKYNNTPRMEVEPSDGCRKKGLDQNAEGGGAKM